MPNLENKVAVVTGAGRGIGRAIAEGYARAGVRVCCAARSEDQIAETANAIIRAGGEAMYHRCDVADADAVNELFQQAVSRFGGVDIVVANAGIQPEGSSVEQGDPAIWKSIIDTNLMGVYHSARLAIPHLRQRGAGKIIVVGSGAGHRGMPNSSAYSCSKAAVWMLVRVLAQEVAQYDISVNELIPGPVDTDMVRSGISAANIAQMGQFEWFKQPEDVVPLALYLATLPNRGPTAQSFSLMRREG